MKFEDILAISGKPGLYELVAQGRGGIVVSSLEDNRKIQIPASAQVSALKDISVYTYEEEVPLVDVFKIMKEHLDGKQAPGHKESGKVLEDFFAKALPNYDQDRVYVSDIKKIVQWYNKLASLDLLDFEEAEPAKEEKEEAKKEETSKS